MEVEESNDTTGKSVIEDSTPTKEENPICDDVADRDAKDYEEMDISEKMDIAEKSSDTMGKSVVENSTPTKDENAICDDVADRDAKDLEEMDISEKMDIAEKTDISIQKADGKETTPMEVDDIQGGVGTTTSSETDPIQEKTEYSKVDASVIVPQQHAVEIRSEPDHDPAPNDSKEETKPPPEEPLKNQQEDAVEENLSPGGIKTKVSMEESTVKGNDVTNEHAVEPQQEIPVPVIDIEKGALREDKDEHNRSVSQSVEGLQSEETKDAEKEAEVSMEESNAKDNDVINEHAVQPQQEIPVIDIEKEASHEDKDEHNRSVSQSVEGLQSEETKDAEKEAEVSMEESTVKSNVTNEHAVEPQQEIPVPVIDIEKGASREDKDEHNRSVSQSVEGLQSEETKDAEKEAEVSMEESNAKDNDVINEHAVQPQQEIPVIDIEKEASHGDKDEHNRSVSQSVEGLQSEETKDAEKEAEVSMEESNAKGNDVINEHAVQPQQEIPVIDIEKGASHGDKDEHERSVSQSVEGLQSEETKDAEKEAEVSMEESNAKDNDVINEHAVQPQEIPVIDIEKGASHGDKDEHERSVSQSVEGLQSEETKDAEKEAEVSMEESNAKDNDVINEHAVQPQEIPVIDIEKEVSHEDKDEHNRSVSQSVEGLQSEETKDVENEVEVSMEESTIKDNDVTSEHAVKPQWEISVINIKKEVSHEDKHEHDSSVSQSVEGLQSEKTKDVENEAEVSMEESTIKGNDVTSEHAVKPQLEISVINIKKEVLHEVEDEHDSSVSQSVEGLQSDETKDVENEVKMFEDSKTSIKEEEHIDVEKTNNRGSIISNIVSRLAIVGPKSQTLKDQEEDNKKTVEERASSSILGRHGKGDQMEHVRKSPGAARKMPPLAPLKTDVFIYVDSSANSTQQDHQSRICSNCCQAISEVDLGKWTKTSSGQQKQFCSNACMNISPSKLAICSFCKKDLKGTQDKVCAPSGPKGKFLEFCSHECVVMYEKRKNAGTHCYCAVCSALIDLKQYKYSLKLKGRLYRLCATECQKAFMRDNNVQPVKTCHECKAKFSQEGITHEVNGVKQFFCSRRCQSQKKSSSDADYTNCLICKKINSTKQLTEVESPDGEKLRVCAGLCVTRLMHRLKTRNISLLPKSSNIGTNKNGQNYATQPHRGSTALSLMPSLAVANHSQQQVTPVHTQSDKSSVYVTNPVNCNHCNTYQPPLYHLTMSDNTVRNFCSYPCVIGFQSQFNMPPVTLPQEELKLQCKSCQRNFTGKPVTLSWKNDVHFFCCEDCAATYKKTYCVIIVCDNCIEERIHHTTIYFSGKERNFCSEGCQLLYKQSFTQKLGLRWCICNYCAQIGPTVFEKKSEGLAIKFCSKKCREKYDQWQKQLVKCEGCKQQGRLLTETFMWRGEVRKVCNQLCLLLFYTQQNLPNMLTEIQQNIPNGKQAKVASTIPVISNVVSLASEQNAGIRKKPAVEMVTKQTQITTTPVQPKPIPMPSLPPPKQVRNKMTLCKPIQQTKSTYCKPLTITKETNTEEDWRPKLVVVPIPVPIYVPVPMQMYTTPVPYPLGVPTPVPIPIFLPVSTGNADKLIETINDIKNRTPSDPLEAELLAMASAIAGEDENTVKILPEPDDDGSLSMETTDINTDALALLTEAEDSPCSVEPVSDDDAIEQLEKDIVALSTMMGGDATSEKPVITEKVDAPSSEGMVSRSTRSGRQPTKAEVKQPSPIKKRKRASQRSSTRNKRTKVDSESEEEEIEVEETPEKLVDKQTIEDRHYSIGVGAYKLWVVTKNAELKQKSQQGGKAFSFKVDILANTSEELSYTLSHFVKEARKPDGEEYPPALLFYTLLAIQHYLFNSGHPDNIFTDLTFSRFMEYLIEKIQTWQPEFKPETSVVINSNITEDLMWECKQLGAHSPYVLLNTLVYFNTKFFFLKTVKDHRDLLFGMMFKDWKKSGQKNKIVCLRYFPSRLRKKLEETTCKIMKRNILEQNYLEQTENLDNPLQCPVKLYEFYLSKCPETVKGKQNSLYLIPERLCIPDSPVWYSSCTADDTLLGKMLAKTMMVKDIHEYWAEKGDEVDNDNTPEEEDS